MQVSSRFPSPKLAMTKVHTRLDSYCTKIELYLSVTAFFNPITYLPTYLSRSFEFVILIALRKQSTLYYPILKRKARSIVKFKYS